MQPIAKTDIMCARTASILFLSLFISWLKGKYKVKISVMLLCAGMPEGNIMVISYVIFRKIHIKKEQGAPKNIAG